MRARVIEVDKNQIYLEVDRQVRFKTPYVMSRTDLVPSNAQDVEFRFGRGFIRPTIIIEDVIETPTKR